MSSVAVPKPFCIRPFYDPTSFIEIDDERGFLSGNYKPEFLFYDDIKRFIKKDTEELMNSPWNEPSSSLALARTRWNDNGKPLIKAFLKNRDRFNAKPLMIQYAAIYIQCNHWVDGKPVEDLHRIASIIQHMSYAPVNLEDRLNFILESAGHHHAFTALDQLYTESAKKWALYLS
jgi:hypothetical protein